MNFVIVGGGKKVDFLVRSLLAKKNKITLINENERECKRLVHEHDIPTIFGDGSKPFILEDAGIKKADLLIALTPKDEDNLVICQLAKNQFQVGRVFAIVNNPKNVTVFKKLGVDTVVSGTYTLASIIEQMASMDEIVNSISIEDGKIQLIELHIMKGHRICGKQLSDIDFPENAIVGCIIRNNNVFIPNGRSEIYADDKLTILASAEVQEKAVSVLIGS